MLFRFAQPEYFWLLLLVPLLSWLLGRPGMRAAVKFPSVSLARQVSGLVRSRTGRWSLKLRWLVLALLITALARPQFGDETSEINSSGVDIVIAVDLSTSMWAHDFEVAGVRQDRLTVVKSVLQRFISERPSDRMGLVAFAAFPYLVSPLTLNHEWLLQRLGDVQIGSIEDGTAIGSAIASASNRLRDQKSDSKILILLTDGANNRGQITPAQAAKAAAALDIKVYAIGVGREGIVPFPALNNRTGQPLRDRGGNLMFERARSDIDHASLELIAKETGGLYFHAQDLRELEAVYAEIDRLEKTDIEMKTRRNYSEAFFWPLALAMLLLALEWLLSQTRFRRLP